MAELRYDIFTNAEQTAQRYEQATRRMIRRAEQLTRAQESAARSLQFPQASVSTQGAQQQAAQIQRVTQAQQRETAARAQATTVQQRQLRTALTALSTLEGENRAFAESERFAIRRAQALGQNIDFTRRLTAAQQRLRAADRAAANAFSLQNVNAKNLRRNMMGLNQSVGQLTRSMSVLAFGPLSGVGARLLTVQQAAETGGRSMVGLALGVAGVAAGLVGLVTVTNRSIRDLDALQKQADRLGVSFESLQELQFVGARQGVQDITKAIDAFAKRIGEAGQGTGEAQTAIEELGLSMSDLAGRDVIEQLEIVADRFAEVETATERNAIASDLASRANQDLAQALVLGSAGIQELRKRARDLGVVLDEDAGRQAERAADRMTELGFLAQQAGRQIGTELTPTLIKAAEASIDAGVEFANFVSRVAESDLDRARASLEQELEVMEDRLASFRNSFRLFPEDQGEFQPDNPIMRGFFEVGEAIVELFGVDVVGSLEEAQERIAEIQALLFQQDQRQLADALGVTPEAFREASRSIDTFTEDAEEAADSVAEIVQEIQNLRNQRSAFEAGGSAGLERERARQEARETLSGLSTQGDRLLIARELELVQANEERVVSEDKLVSALTERILTQQRLEESVEGLGEAQEKAAGERAKLRREQEESNLQARLGVAEIERENEELRRRIEATRQGTDALRAFNTELAIEEAQLAFIEEAGGPISPQALERIREAVSTNQRLNQTLDETEESAKQVEQLFSNAAENIQRAWGDTFTDIFRGGVDSFEELGDRILDIFARLAGEAAALLVFRPVVQGVQTGGVLSQIFSGTPQTAGGFGVESLQLGPLPSILGESVQEGAAAGTEKGAFAGLRAALSGLQGVFGGGGGGGANLAGLLGGAGSAVGAVGSVLGALGLVGGIGGLASFGGANTLQSLGLGLTGGAVAGGLGLAGGGLGAALLTNPLTFGAGIALIAAGSIPNAINLGQNATLGSDALRTQIGDVSFGEAFRDVFLQTFSPTAAIAGAIISQTSGGRAPRVGASAQTFAEDPGGGAIESPFGFIASTIPASLAGRRRVTGLPETFAALDRFIAEGLSESETARAATSIQSLGDLGFFDRPGNVQENVGRLLVQRARAALSPIEEVEDISRFFLEGSAGTLEMVTGEVRNFFERLSEFRGSVRELTGEEVPQLERRFIQLENTFAETSEFARQFGFDVERVSEAFEEGRQKLLGDFLRDLDIAILEQTDPLAAALARQSIEAERRLAEARVAKTEGALDAIAKAEQLNALERAQLIEDFTERANAPLNRLLRDIQQGDLGGRSFAERIDQARQAFETTRAAAFGAPSDIQVRTEFADAARTLIELQREQFGSAAPFFESLRFIESSLESLRDLPVTSADTTLPQGASTSSLQRDQLTATQETNNTLQRLVDELEDLRDTDQQTQEILRDLIARLTRLESKAA